MKVRIGVGLGANALLPGELGPLVDALDRLGFDSIWLSEILTGSVLDPVAGLAWAAAHNPRLKLGTTILLPGRNPVRLAKELATVDALSEGRLLVTFVPGLTHPPEREAIGVAPKERGAVMDEVMPLLRKLWAGEAVSHSGATATFDDVTLSPLPHQQPLEMWLGGMAPAALERCGRLSDGWLPSLCTPAEAADGRSVIEAAAARAGRQISPEHFGVSVGYASRPLDEQTRRAMTARTRRATTEVLPVGMSALRDLLERYIGVGFSKFVIRPLIAADGWLDELDQLAGAVGDLQT